MEMNQKPTTAELTAKEVCVAPLVSNVLEDAKEDPMSHKNNYVTSVLMLTNSKIGINVLIMPKLFHLSGTLLGTLQLVLIAAISFKTSLMLCSVGNAFGMKSYFEICDHYFKGNNRYFIHILFLGLILGNILCFQAFVLQCFIRLVQELYFAGKIVSLTQMTLMKIIVCLIVNLFILPFVFIRKAKFVNLLANVCTIGMLVGILVIFGAYLFPALRSNSSTQDHVDPVKYVDFNGLYASIGVYMMSFCFHLAIVDVNAGIYPKTQRSTNIVVISNCLSSLSLYFIVSVFGYLATSDRYNDGHSTSNYFIDLILSNQQNSSLLFAASFVTIVAVILGNVNNYLAFIRFLNWKLNKTSDLLSSKLLENLSLGFSFVKNEPTNEEYDANYTRVYNSIVLGTYLIIISATLFITLFDVRIEMIFDFFAATCASPVCIIIPSYLYLHILDSGYIAEAKQSQWVIAYCMIGIGIVLWVFSIFAAYEA